MTGIAFGPVGIAIGATVGGALGAFSILKARLGHKKAAAPPPPPPPPVPEAQSKPAASPKIAPAGA